VGASDAAGGDGEGRPGVCLLSVEVGAARLHSPHLTGCVWEVHVVLVREGNRVCWRAWLLTEAKRQQADFRFESVSCYTFVLRCYTSDSGATQCPMLHNKSPRLCGGSVATQYALLYNMRCYTVFIATQYALLHNSWHGTCCEIFGTVYALSYSPSYSHSRKLLFVIFN
jgi:hypothetical protein